MRITESNPVVPFGWVKVLYQRGKEVHFGGEMDRDQVCGHRLAVELSIGPGELASNIFVAVGARLKPGGRTGAALKLHLGVS